MNKISVVVAAYNCESTIEACLVSIEQQSFIESLQVIVVLDAPTDNSAQVVQRFCRDRKAFTVVALLKNVGVSMARNIGMQHSQGEYIGFVDADDQCHPRMYQCLFEAACEGMADLAYCEMAAFSTQSPSERNQAMSCEFLFQNTFVTNKIFKRELLIKHKIQFYKDQIFEDEPFVYTAWFSSQQTVAVNQRLYFYRVGQQSLCNDPNNQGLKARNNLHEKQLMLSRFMLDVQNRHQLKNQADKILECLCHHALAALYYRLPLSDLLSFYSFINYLIDKYGLRPYCTDSSSYYVSRFTKFQASPWLIVALKLRIAMVTHVQSLRFGLKSFGSKVLLVKQVAYES
ncbi:glycosyltransferase [Alginatibacterium sediminis]|uniref:Glycosyltransferase n=1 Tax=Alginatibacterium sediminis TaxID=2164068 RepID=A0A420EDN8_9ALTE|nr:glycosyltransferase [Alginatibacterium sediminis]RKF18791.1 glycosyltransferase [Alginatibacterium sediminis]